MHRNLQDRAPSISDSERSVRIDRGTTVAQSSEVPVTRREWLSETACGFAAIAAINLLAQEGKLQAADQPGDQAAQSRSSDALQGLHHPARAERIIQIFLGGGLSHIDSFDYKPELERYHGQEMPESFGKADVFFGKVGKLHQSHFEFKQRGQSGLWVSELFPQLAQQADELTVIRSMHAETANHIPGIFQANTGFRQMGFPALGAWLSYGLGTTNQDLPGFVVLPDSRGIPNAAGGSFNWTSGFLPATHQGVAFDTRRETPIRDLSPAMALNENEPADAEELRRQFQARLDARHQAEHDSADPLVARIRSYELAARMQSAIPDATDLASESAETRASYGLDDDATRDVARNCLTARRLVERGVRMVQIWTGDGVSWDAHDDVLGDGYKSHRGEAKRVDKPVAALIADLKQRGLLETTLVMITTEFGRTPFAQANQGTLSRGRDHHPQGFTNVLVGGGLKPGVAHGATDEIGYAAVESPVTTYDMHATVLHLMGIDHEKLTFYHNGIQRRLTNVHGQVIREILS